MHDSGCGWRAGGRRPLFERFNIRPHPGDVIHHIVPVYVVYRPSWFLVYRFIKSFMADVYFLMLALVSGLVFSSSEEYSATQPRISRSSLGVDFGSGGFRGSSPSWIREKSCSIWVNWA